MHVNHIGLRVEMIVPDMFEQHGAGDDLALMFHQKLQQFEFTRLKRNFNVTAKGAARQQINFQIRNPVAGLDCIGTDAAVEAFHPGQKFGK